LHSNSQQYYRTAVQSDTAPLPRPH